MKKLLTLAVAAAMTLSVAAASATTLKLSEVHAEGYPTTLADQEFARLIEEKTEGRIKVEVYSGGQLYGEETGSIEALQLGDIAFARVSASPVASYVPALNAIQMPYLYKNADHMWAVLDGEIGKDMLAQIEASGSGLVGLCWLDAGSRCFYATKSLNTVEDFKNVKFRVMQSSIYQDTVSALGAIPISMSGSEVYSALQTGLVDGAENNIPRIIDMSHNELCKYLILDRHNIMPEMVIVSASTWNRLDEADRTILKECAANLQANMIAAWGETEQAALDTLAAGGMIITEPDAELLTALREAEQPVYDQYGAAYADLVEQIENIQY